MKHIRKTYCGTFSIEKNINGRIINYGSFKDLKQAKEYRDLCIEQNWDDQLRPKNNLSTIYPLRYIRKRPSGNYEITKKINGKTEQYGTFKTLSEAINERDLLIKYNWDYDLLCEHVEEISMDLFNKDDYTIMDKFYRERQISQRTQYGYNNSFSLYVRYTKMHLNELLLEADLEEEQGVRWKKSKLKEKLIGFRGWLQEKYKYSTIKVLFNRIKTFYNHFEIEIGFIPQLNQKGVIKSEPITYDDIPDKEMLQKCVEHASPLMKALILFMTSSGCARRETLNLTIPDFIEATNEYHNNGSVNEILTELIIQDNVIPTFKIRRQKTNKFYYTFCSPEAVKSICAYLLSSGRRFDKGHNHHLLFKTNLDALNNEFQELNRICDGGQVAGMNRIRSHMFRKFHASRLYNNGMSIDKIDALQGRAKDNTHNAYFKESPEKLKELYINHMDCVKVV